MPICPCMHYHAIAGLPKKRARKMAIMSVASMAARAAISVTPRRPSSSPGFQRTADRFGRRVSSLCTSSPSSSSSNPKKLVLYSKPGCCLCDGLKEKLEAAFTFSGPHSISNVELQIRDITTNPEWEKAFQYEIPVLARVLPDGTEEILPRLSPRLGIELLQKKIYSAMVE